jgi:allophanate hydrolase
VGAPGVICGGSSSGSAVAVAAGQVDVALGTDTAGSGRVPAALNGIVGLKPTRGLVPTDGVVPACRSLDCVSVFARTVAEARLVLGVMAAGPGREGTLDARRALTAPARPVLGVAAPGALPLHGDEEAGALYGAAVDRLRAMGAEVREVDLAPYLEAARLLYEGPWIAERLAAFGEFVLAHPAEVDPVVREVVARSVAPTAADAYRGMYALEALVARAAPVWASVDALALPTHVTAPTHAQVAADPHGVQARLGTYTNFVNLMDLCAVSVPAGRRACGVGFGLQLVAPALGDALVCDLAARFEAAAAPAASVHLAVVGAHLTGQPLNHQLTSRGARLVRTTRTAAGYRLYALRGTTPPKPGLVRGDGDGTGPEVEVWELGLAAFGAFTAEVPPPLGIGTVTLADGTAVKGFVCEPAGLEGAEDITAHGGWRAYLRGGGDGR